MSSNSIHTRPNIVVILSHDTGCHFGCYGVPNGKRTVAAYVDGKLNSAAWNGSSGTRRPAVPSPGRFGFLFHQGMQSGRVVYDNLKVWNYAKTDFADRNDE